MFLKCLPLLKNNYVGVPEWSNGLGLGPSSLVLTQVRVLSCA